MRNNELTVDVIIIGAGAAGLLCAIEAGKRGRSVLILERSNKVGEKIRISGGGRCNFTNLDASPEHYLSQNPAFPTSALSRYTPDDITALLDKHRIPYHEKIAGQLFCTRRAQDLLDVLLLECKQAKVEIRTDCDITDIGYSTRYRVQTNHGTLLSDSLVVATGGISIPKLGATDFGYRIAKQFGLSVVTPKPGLVPFICGEDDAPMCNSLSGVSIDSLVSVGKKSFRESLLFTHRGLSGPAILQISSFWSDGDTLTINFSPDIDLLTTLKDRHQSRKDLVSILSTYFPKRFAQVWCERFIPPKKMNQYSNKEFDLIARRLHNWEMTPLKTEGFGKAEVTCGGIDTRELSSKTMEAKKQPGLYFIGEVVDVTGELGGYNFQWAWASGFAAGKVV